MSNSWQFMHKSCSQNRYCLPGHLVSFQNRVYYMSVNISFACLHGFFPLWYVLMFDKKPLTSPFTWHVEVWLGIYCERRWTSSQSRASFCCHIWELKTTHISLRIDLRHIAHGRKNMVFICRTYIYDEAGRPDPTMMLFDGLFLNGVQRYELEMFTQHRNWLYYHRITFWLRRSEFFFWKNRVFPRGNFSRLFQFFWHIS